MDLSDKKTTFLILIINRTNMAKKEQSSIKLIKLVLVVSLLVGVSAVFGAVSFMLAVAK